MARRQVAILSINRGVTTLNGLVVERASGEDPYQAGIRAVTEQIAAPSRRKVQVVATDDASRIRMYVHPDGQITDIETLEIFEPSTSPEDEPGAGWVAVPPRQAGASAPPSAEEDFEPYVPPAAPVESVAGAPAGDGTTGEQAGAEAHRDGADDDDVPEREQTAERPPVRAPLFVPEPDLPAEAAEPAAQAEEPEEVPEREQTAERPAIREPLAAPEAAASDTGADTGEEGAPEPGPAAPPVIPVVIRKPPFEPPSTPDAAAATEPDDSFGPGDDPQEGPDEAPAAATPSAPAYSEGGHGPEPLPPAAPPSAPEAIEPPDRVGPLVRVAGPAAAAGGGSAYRRPRSRLTGRGRVVIVVAVVVLLLLIYAAVRAASSSGCDCDSPAVSARPGGSRTPSAGPSAPTSTVAPTTLAPSPSPSAPPAGTMASKPKPAPVQYTRTLTVKAVSETEAIELVITASRLPVTATIRMDPWGAPEPFTTTVRLTEPGQKVMVKPVASGHAKWSVKVDGAKKVTGYTHSWPKGKRTYVKR